MKKQIIAPSTGAVSEISPNVSADDNSAQLRSLDESKDSFKGLFSSIRRIDSAILRDQFINDNPQTGNDYEAN